MAAKQTPRDALVIQAILKDMGITEYEPRVVNQLMEFVYRYVTNVLDDAKAYANHAKKKAIDLDDVKLAVTMQIDQSFTSPPDRELLMELARSKNVIPLPSVKPHCGIRLPADCYCMTACNYRLKSLKKGNKSGLGAGGSGASASRMSTLGGVKAVLRPNSPIVRVTSASTTAASTTPRAVVKVSTPATTTTPKIQITIPQQPAAPPADKPESDTTRGIKREREDDEDYDA